jgi:hypothetical protein
MGAIQRVEDLDSAPIIIGRSYLVRSVSSMDHGMSSVSRVIPPSEPLPVRGDWHEDKKHINFKRWHYHYDHRFTSLAVLRALDDLYQKFFPDRRGSNTGRNEIMQKSMGALFTTNGTNEPKTRYSEMKCLRELTADDFAFLRFPELEKAYEGREVSKCGSCPHKGFDLNHEPIYTADNGKKFKICPGHGLPIGENNKVISPKEIGVRR